MKIKNFQDYLFRLDIVNDFFSNENVSKEKYVQNLIEKANNSEDICSRLFDFFSVDTRSYLSVLIESNQVQTFERIRKGLINKLQELQQINSELESYNSFSDGVLKNTIIIKHLGINLVELLQYKVLYFAFTKSILDLIFNDTIFNKSDILDAKIKFDHDITKHFISLNNDNKEKVFNNKKIEDSKLMKFEKSINNVVCPVWMTLKGFYIFNEFLLATKKKNEMELSYIIKKLIHDNEISKDKGYTDFLYSNWLVENYNLTLTKVRSINESKTDGKELIYETILKYI